MKALQAHVVYTVRVRVRMVCVRSSAETRVRGLRRSSEEDDRKFAIL